MYTCISVLQAVHLYAVPIRFAAMSLSSQIAACSCFPAVKLKYSPSASYSDAFCLRSSVSRAVSLHLSSLDWANWYRMSTVLVLTSKCGTGWSPNTVLSQLFTWRGRLKLVNKSQRQSLVHLYSHVGKTLNLTLLIFSHMMNELAIETTATSLLKRLWRSASFQKKTTTSSLPCFALPKIIRTTSWLPTNEKVEHCASYFR